MSQDGTIHRHRRLGVANAIPAAADALTGELLVNIADGRVYTRAGDDIADVGIDRPYISRAAAQAATVPLVQQRLSLISSGMVLHYVRDASGTALTTADGANWSPDGTLTPLHFGAVGDGVADDTAAIRAMLDWAPSGAVCNFVQPSAHYSVEASNLNATADFLDWCVFVVARPMTLTGKGLIKVADNSDFVSLSLDGERGRLFCITSSDVVIDGLNIDMNFQNNAVSFGGSLYYSNHPDLDGEGINVGYDAIITWPEPDTATIRRVKVLNCHITNCSNGGIILQGRRMGSTLVADTATTGMILDSVVEGNFIEGGQRSTIVFIGGVRNSVMRNNHVKNPNWVGLRFYLQTYGCISENNVVTYDGRDIVPQLVNKNDANIRFDGNPRPRFMQFGHQENATGTVQNCIFRNNMCVSVEATSLNSLSFRDGLFVGVNANNNVVDGCHFEGSMQNGVKAEAVSDLVIKNCVFKNLWEDNSVVSCAVNFTGGTVRPVVEGNVMDNCIRGITSFSTGTGNITNAKISDNYINGGSASIRFERNFIDGVVSNCVVTGAPLDGINFLLANGVVLVGNTVDGATRNGIVLSGENVSVVSNLVVNYGDNGIRMNAVCDTFLVQSNKLVSATGNIGLFVSSTSTDVALVGNDLRGAATTAISDSGTGTVNTGNLT